MQLRSNSNNNKRIFLSLAFVVVVILIFSFGNKSTIKNQAGQKVGLVYGDKTLGDFVNTDSDNDGVLDWEEGLWGTDYFNSDTDGDGVPDGVEIAQLKGIDFTNAVAGNLTEPEENLTETEKFSREVFTTVTTLSQIGVLDQATIEGLGSSLAEQIANPAISKVFLFGDIKTTGNNTEESLQVYLNSLNGILKKQPTLYKNGYDGIIFNINMTFSNVLQKYLLNPDNDKVFSDLDQIIKEINNTINGMENLTVPTGLSLVHLDIMNGFQRVKENMINVKYAVKDPIIAMGAASKYEENGLFLEGALNKLRLIVKQ